MAQKNEIAAIEIVGDELGYEKVFGLFMHSRSAGGIGTGYFICKRFRQFK
jgi:hypothetical protein